MSIIFVIDMVNDVAIGYYCCDILLVIDMVSFCVSIVVICYYSVSPIVMQYIRSIRQYVFYDL